MEMLLKVFREVNKTFDCDFSMGKLNNLTTDNTNETNYQRILNLLIIMLTLSMVSDLNFNQMNFYHKHCDVDIKYGNILIHIPITNRHKQSIYQKNLHIQTISQAQYISFIDEKSFYLHTCTVLLSGYYPVHRSFPSSQSFTDTLTSRFVFNISSWGECSCSF